MQLAEVSKLITSADRNHKSIMAAVLLQEMQLFWAVWELVRDSCSELLAPNSHLTGEQGRVAQCLATNRVRVPHHMQQHAGMSAVRRTAL